MMAVKEVNRPKLRLTSKIFRFKRSLDSNDGYKVTMHAVNVGFAVVAKVRESETRSSERVR